jgi:hypothetical protein
MPWLPQSKDTQDPSDHAPWIIDGVLSFEVHRALAELTRAVHRVTTAAVERAPFDEIDLRIEAALSSVSRLEAMIGSEFHGLRRHLGWLRRRHREGAPELADGDIVDLREHDLPAAITAVEKWSEALLDPVLVVSIEGSWRAQQYDAAVRESFVLLEQRMREVAAVAPSEGVVGRRLVARLLPGGGPSDRWSADGFMGHLTEGEQGRGRRTSRQPLLAAAQQGPIRTTGRGLLTVGAKTAGADPDLTRRVTSHPHAGQLPKLCDQLFSRWTSLPAWYAEPPRHFSRHLVQKELVPVRPEAGVWQFN